MVTPTENQTPLVLMSALTMQPATLISMGTEGNARMIIITGTRLNERSCLQCSRNSLNLFSRFDVWSITMIMFEFLWVVLCRVTDHQLVEGS